MSAPRAMFVVLGVLVAIAAVARVFGWVDAASLNETTLWYVCVAAALLVFPDVRSIAFGDFKLELEKRVSSMESKLQDTQAAAIGSGKVPSRANSGIQETNDGEVRSAGRLSGDPWKGKFGGNCTSDGRELSARVIESGVPEWYRVVLTVKSTAPLLNPLRGTVQFFLHDSFPNNQPIVAVDVNGVAELALNAWGAFTVGVSADGGNTRLELDLAELKSAPQRFRER